MRLLFWRFLPCQTKSNQGQIAKCSAATYLISFAKPLWPAFHGQHFIHAYSILFQPDPPTCELLLHPTSNQMIRRQEHPWNHRNLYKPLQDMSCCWYVDNVVKATVVTTNELQHFLGVRRLCTLAAGISSQRNGTQNKSTPISIFAVEWLIKILPLNTTPNMRSVEIMNHCHTNTSNII